MMSQIARDILMPVMCSEPRCRRLPIVPGTRLCVYHQTAEPTSGRLQLFDAAFNELLSSLPDAAPTPTLLNLEMGYCGNNLDGALSARRIVLLRRAGFVKRNGRWRRP